MNQIYYLYVCGEDYDAAKQTLMRTNTLARLIKDSVSIFNTYYDKIHYHSVHPVDPATLNYLMIQETENMYSFFKKWYPK